MRAHNFDGLDIDWEYPQADDRGGLLDDMENYVDLLSELKQAFDATPEKYTLTIAVPLSYWYLRHFDLEKIHPIVDFMNIMSYDIHGIWDANITDIGPHVYSHTNISEIRDALNIFFKNGVPPDNLVLGIGAYGRTYTLKDPSCHHFGCEFSGPGNAGKCTKAPGTLAYFEIKHLLETDTNARSVYDSQSLSMYVYTGDQFISYDSLETLRKKKEFAKQFCMRGMMLWATDMLLKDDSLSHHHSHSHHSHIQ